MATELVRLFHERDIKDSILSWERRETRILSDGRVSSRKLLRLRTTGQRIKTAWVPQGSLNGVSSEDFVRVYLRNGWSRSKN